MRRYRLRVEKPQDLWVGAFWDRGSWWGGTMEALDAATATKGDSNVLKHHRFDLWVCLIPMVPIHFEWIWYPQPTECNSSSCWVRDVGSIKMIPW